MMYRSLAAALFAMTASAALAANDPLAELRHTFTVGGKPVPPWVFADFGDSDLGDSNRSIRVTIDLRAAIGSELYFGPIQGTPRGWQSQPKVSGNGADKLTETTGYRFVGTTRNGLMVVVASYNGGGSGWFTTLHILDAAPGRAFDDDGKPYERLNLTVVRNIVLGDRWKGEVKIVGDSITIFTQPGPPANSDTEVKTRTIEAQRP